MNKVFPTMVGSIIAIIIGFLYSMEVMIFILFWLGISYLETK